MENMDASINPLFLPYSVCFSHAGLQWPHCGSGFYICHLGLCSNAILLEKPSQTMLSKAPCACICVRAFAHTHIHIPPITLHLPCFVFLSCSYHHMTYYIFICFVIYCPNKRKDLFCSETKGCLACSRHSK